MSAEKLEQRTPEQVLRRFARYLEVFGLDDAVARGDSIAVVGAGDNAFAAGVEEYNKISGHEPFSPFIVGIEPLEHRYHVLHPQLINHDARNIGLPDDTFDTTVSLDGVPKYFFMWLTSPSEKEKILKKAEARQTYAYDITREVSGDKNQETITKVVDAMVTAFSEMIRITKPGGPVRVHPLFSKSQILRSDIFSLPQALLLSAYGAEIVLMNMAVTELKKMFPKLEVRTFKEASTPDGDGTFSLGVEFIKHMPSRGASSEVLTAV